MKLETKISIVLVLLVAYAFLSAINVFAAPATDEITMFEDGSWISNDGTSGCLPLHPCDNGTYVHIGDCGMDRYNQPESGASGYCYVDQTHGHKAMTVIQPARVIMRDEVTPACVTTNEYHPCEN